MPEETLREVIEQLVRAQADRTDLIETLWIMFAAHVKIPPGGTQWVESRRCFFAGARTVFEAILLMMEPGGDDPDRRGSQRIDRLWKELERFNMDMQQESFMSEARTHLVDRALLIL
jgi:hypothetical protein